MSLTLIDVISIFLKNKSKIFIITGLVCLVSITLYFFVFDLIFLSSATIKSSSKSSGLLSALESGLPDIEGLDELSGGGGKSAKELAAYEEILKSRRCLEEVIKKFGLQDRDDFLFMEDAIKNFREEKMQINVEKLSGTMTVSVLDKDPKLAKEIVEYLLLELDKINIELNVTNARNNREFIEKRYNEAIADLTKSEDSLKSFQMIYGMAPDLQIKASAQSVFSMEAELKSEEVKLDVLRKILSPDQPEIKLQEEKVSSIKNKISEIENSTDLDDFLRLGNSPQIAMSYLRLQRNLEIQTKIVTFMLPLFEQAKIEEKRETPTVLVLDKPYIAERKTKPKRLTMVVILTFVGFCFGVSYYVAKLKFKEFLENSKF